MLRANFNHCKRPKITQLILSSGNTVHQLFRNEYTYPGTYLLKMNVLCERPKREWGLTFHNEHSAQNCCKLLLNEQQQSLQEKVFSFKRNGVPAFNEMNAFVRCRFDSRFKWSNFESCASCTK